MRRTVSARLDLAIGDPAEIALQIAAAAGERVDELLEVHLDGAPVTWQEVEGAHGGRAHLVHVGRGQLAVTYTATVIGRAAPPTCGDDERLVYLRPSRYAESDRLAEVGRRQFGGLTDPAEILGAVSSWVGWELGYEAGSSLPTHGAVDTLLGGRGVCRDFAHLVVALLRARDVPGAGRRRLRTGPAADGLPRGRGGARRRHLARRRRDAARAALVARAHRDRAATPPTRRSSP